MSRIDDIKAALKKHGPMTTRQIGEKLGMNQNAVGYHIGIVRKYTGGIRIHSFNMACPTKKERVYELGTAKDYEFPHWHRPPSVLKKAKYPKLTPEERAFIQYLKSAAAQIQPFRDEMVFRTAGRRP
jgi:hypothetical protein